MIKIAKTDIRKGNIFFRGVTGNSLKLPVTDEQMQDILDILFEDKEDIDAKKVEIEDAVTNT